MMREFVRSGRIWIFGVVGLLLLNVGVCAVTVVAATGDPVAAAVEPDYYQKAVDWDEDKARWPAPERLGWTIQAREQSAGVVTFDVLGPSADQALTGRVEARRVGQTLETVRADLEPGEEGGLLWRTGGLTPGQWTITLWLEQADVRARESFRLMLGE
ncbi:MAG: FixH family protein [Phycisphaerales bacterium JB059]